MKYAAFALAAVAAAGMASAQSNGAKWVPLNQAQPAPVATPAPQVAAPAVVQQAAPVQRFLPAGTLISLTPVEELTSKHMKEGAQYQFIVVNDVVDNGVVVIPRGSNAIGV